MSYRIKGKNGLPIKKDGQFLMGYDIPELKIEQLDEREMTFLAVGSTEDEDRDKDIIRVSGWQLGNFKNNPVLPWSHNYYEPPVGKAIMIKKDNTKKKLIFKPKFDANDAKAVLIFNKYKNGYLNTFSVGFLGIERNLREEGNYWGGSEYTKQELLEISPVTVPCNPNANLDIRSMSDDFPPNLVQMGYKQFMCKTDSGLFIPVTDTEIYTSPFIIPMEKGIKGVYASLVDDPESKDKQLIGFVFPEDMDEKEANEFAKEKNDNKAKVKYFDMGEKQIGSSDFELEIIEEEGEEEHKEINDGSEENDIEDDGVNDKEDDQDVDNAGEEEIKELTNDIEEKNKEEHTIEISVVITDFEGKEVKRSSKVQKKDLTEEDFDKILGDVFSDTKNTSIDIEVKEINLNKEQLQSIVDTVVSEVKKYVVTEKEIDNNEDNESEVELSEETDESKSGDIIEFDALSFSPVDEEENSEDIIEIDEKVFDEVKSQIGSGTKGIKSNLKEVLEKSIKKALDDFSGKLDD